MFIFVNSEILRNIPLGHVDFFHNWHCHVDAKYTYAMQIQYFD